MANEQILDRDSENRDVFFVVKGEVRVVNYSRSGREIAYARVGPGGYFGELAAIDGQSRSASIVAAEECLVAALPPDVFVGLLADSPDLTVRVLKRLSGIIRSCDDRIMDLSTLRAVQRVYIELLQLAELDAATQSHWVIYPMRTQNMIASRAGTTRETVARVLGQLTTAGIVERKAKTLYVRDRARLEFLADASDPNRDEEVSR